MKRYRRQSLLLFVCVMLTVAISAAGQVSYNTPLTEEEGLQYSPQVVASEQARGYFIFWLNNRTGLNEIYVQMLSEDGYPQWGANGQRLITSTTAILDYSVAPDGQGGVYLAWLEKAAAGSGTELHLNRLNMNGDWHWGTPINIGRAGAAKLRVRCVADLNQGVYVIWEQSSNPLDVDIFAQHVNAEGKKYWLRNGVPVIDTDDIQVFEDAVALPEGLAVTWQARSAVLFQILEFKTGKWVKSSPIRPSIISLGQSRPRLARRQSSSETSVFMVWEEGTNIRAQRFSASGERLWGSIGVDVIRATGSQVKHEILADGRGGLVVVWQDSRDSRTGVDLRTQRLNKNGVPQWSSNGVILNNAVESQVGQKLILDPNDGFVCLWEDTRFSDQDIFGQRVNRNGRLKWPTSGVEVSRHPNVQGNIQLATLGSKVLAVWEDRRLDDGDIFAQFVNFDGKLYNVPPFFTSTPIDTAYVGSYYEYQLEADDVDRDFPLTYNPVLLPDWMEFDEESRTLSGIVANIAGEVSLVSVEVIDARGAASKQAFEVRIVDANHPPQIISQPDTVVFEDSLYVYQIVVDDPDSNDVHTLEINELPDWLGVEEESFRLVGVPENEDVGLHRVSLTVKDLAGESAQQDFTIRVLNTNDPPQFLTASTADTAIEDEEYQFEVQWTDPDVGDKVTVDFAIRPGWLQLDVENRLLRGIPTNDDLGDTVAVLIAKDAEGATDTLTLQLYVKNTNDPPFFVSTPKTEAVVDSLYEYAVVVDDVDPDDQLQLFYRIGPNWLNLNPTHFVLSGIPPETAANDSFEVLLEVVDAAGATDEQAFFVHVREQAIPDSTPPSSPINPAVFPQGWTSSDSLTLRWITPADESGVSRIFLKFATPPESNEDFDYSNPIRTIAGAMDSLRFPPLYEGDHRVYLWLGDRKGNADFRTAVPVRYRSDRSAPVPPQPLYPQEWSRGDTVRFVWIAAEDSISGIAAYFIALQQGKQKIELDAFQPEADTVQVVLPLHLSEKIVDWFVVAVDSANNEARSPIRSFSVDNVVPLVIHTPVDTVQVGTPVTFRARVTDIGSGVQRVNLRYRSPIDGFWNQQPMQPANNDVYEATLSAENISPFGLEYILEAMDYAGNRKVWRAADQTTAYRSPVVLGASVPFPMMTRPLTYHMFGVPFYLSQNSPKTFFEDQLGPYDDTQWRLLRYQNGQYVELHEVELDSLMPGRAYWLITRQARQLQISEAATVRSDRPFTLELQPGWNMVASPFIFDIRFDPSSLPDGVEPVLWGFDGSRYRMETQKMVAWKGYFIKNNQTEPVLWELAPEKTGMSKYSDPWANTGWYAKIRVQQNRHADEDNFFGQVQPPHAVFSSSDPPAIGEVPRLFFWKDDAGGEALAMDFIAMDVPEPAWSFRVENLSEGWVNLELEVGKLWPDSLSLWIIDHTTGIEQEFRPDRPIRFWNAKSGGSRDFELRLLSKTRGSGHRAVPTRLQLYPIRPNPFRIGSYDHVTIRFSLVEPVRIRIAVYNVLGQEIWSTPELPYRAGEHAVTWDGRTQSRKLAPNGIYFVHLQVMGKPLRLRRKIVLLR